MAGRIVPDVHNTEIIASWRRCEEKYNLVRTVSRPILRLLAAEVTPRREALQDRLRGQMTCISRLGSLAMQAGNGLIVTDTDRILVQLAGRADDRSEFEHYGISSGSCWAEQVAGTNGVAMAMAVGHPFTVHGKEHYFRRLRPFICMTAPILDAQNRILGAITLLAMDRQNSRSHVFAQHMLSMTARRIQSRLFQNSHKEDLTIALGSTPHGREEDANALLAIDTRGRIVGLTRRAAWISGACAPDELIGKSFEEIYGVLLADLVRTPGGRLRPPDDRIASLTLMPSPPKAVSPSARRRTTADRVALRLKRRHLPVALNDISTGSMKLAHTVRRARDFLANGLPILLEGETGTGKSALIHALLADIVPCEVPTISIDCAILQPGDKDHQFLASTLERTRAMALRAKPGHHAATLVLDNVDELPRRAQASLRGLLGALENSQSPGARSTGDQHGIRVISTTKRDLSKAVATGDFRDDLFFMLRGAHLKLPPLRKREDIGALLRQILATLSDAEVGLSDEVILLARRYRWPGNIREARDALRQALISANGCRIAVCDLPEHMIRPAGDESLQTDQGVRLRSVFPNHDEETRIRDVLGRTRWNVSRAALDLGISRATIYRKIARYNIVRPGS